MKHLLKTLLMSSALVVPAFATAVTFHASIRGENEVPANDSPAWGVANLRLDPATGEFDLVVNLKNFDEDLAASHIHVAPAGVNGPVVVGLGGEDAYRRAGKKNLHGKFSGVIPAAQIETLLANGMYVNFHTAAFPGGATRGQLMANPVELSAELSGANEVPANDSPATGVASILFNPGTKEISVRVEADDYANLVSASHIHEAPVGVNGPVKLNLGPEASYTRVDDSIVGEFLGLVYGGASVPLLTGGTYINVHSPEFPGGEIRGQINGN